MKAPGAWGVCVCVCVCGWGGQGGIVFLYPSGWPGLSCGPHSELSWSTRRAARLPERTALPHYLTAPTPAPSPRRVCECACACVSVSVCLYVSVPVCLCLFVHM